MNEKHMRGVMETIVANATLVYLGAFFLGAVAHYFYPLSVAADYFLAPVGSILVLAGPLLILWSQKSIRRFKREVVSGVSADLFAIGPYRFSRNPTYLGLTLLISGFGFFADSLFIVLSALASFFVVNFVILKKEESALEEKYGDHYREYKEKVRRWL